MISLIFYDIYLSGEYESEIIFDLDDNGGWIRKEDLKRYIDYLLDTGKDVTYELIESLK